MKKFYEFIVEKTFSKSELSTLKDIFISGVNEYHENLQLDPFVYDNTDEDLGIKIEEILKSKNIESFESDIEVLVRCVKLNFI